MTPRNEVVRKSGSPRREPDPPPRKLLSVRSTLILTLAVLAGRGCAVLLYAAHPPAALVALGGVGIFVPALKFFDWLIELGLSYPCRRACELSPAGPAWICAVRCIPITRSCIKP